MSPVLRDTADLPLVQDISIVDWPSISVIVPAYNVGHFLVEGLESVVVQTAPVVEVIVIDDGSTDDSAAVAREFATAHPIVRVLQRENGGAGVARNDGIAVATGEFLTFHDADDVMLGDRVARQVAFLLEHPTVALVIGSIELHFEPDVDQDAGWVRREVKNVAHSEGFNPMAMTARATLFAEVGGFDPSYRLAEDYNFIVRALAHDCTVAISRSIVTKRRIHGGNLIADVAGSQREMFRSLAEHIRTKRNK